MAERALVPTPLWENDLGKLSPVPADLLQQDQQMRAELGTPDVRYLLVVSARDSESALRRLESLDPALRKLVGRGVIAG